MLFKQVNILMLFVTCSIADRNESQRKFYICWAVHVHLIEYIWVGWHHGTFGNYANGSGPVRVLRLGNTQCLVIGKVLRGGYDDHNDHIFIFDIFTYNVASRRVNVGGDDRKPTEFWCAQLVNSAAGIGQASLISERVGGRVVSASANEVFDVLKDVPESIPQSGGGDE